MQGKTRKVLFSVLIVGVAASLVAWGAFSAFSSSTTNPGNSFAAGNVAIADNDAGTALYNVSNRKPGDSEVKCIRVSYTGSLDSDVKLYTPDAMGSLGQYVNLTVEAGTTSPSFPSCTGFTADAGGPLFSGTLASFQSSHNSYASGLADFPGTSATKWINGDAVVYRFTATLQDNDLAQGLTTGTHSFKWEARNQ